MNTERLFLPKPRARVASPRPAAERKPDLESGDELPFLWVLLFVAAHVVLAFLLTRSSMIGAAHAVFTLVAGVFVAFAAKRPEWVAYCAAYVVGSEVMWRIVARMSLPWEFAKYTIVLIMLMALMQMPRRKIHGLAVLYFGLLVPSIVLVMMAGLDLDEIRQQLSFNLSGPLSLAVAVWFFSNIKLTLGQLQRVFLALIGPTVATGGIAIFGILTADSIAIGTGSNRALSAGFGPNQVSAVLALGAFAAIVYLLLSKTSLVQRAFLSIVALQLIGQSALTFSRSGMYMTGISLVIFILAGLRNPRVRGQMVPVVAVIALGMIYIVVPRLDEFTGGAIIDRFESTNLTNRDAFIMADLEVFLSNPLLGVGPGMAEFARKDGGFAASHTEFTRLLAEHGMLGLIAFLVLGAIFLSNVAASRNPTQVAIALSFAAWGGLFMAASGMRLAAPSFMFGCAAVTFVQGAIRSRSATRVTVAKHGIQKRAIGSPGSRRLPPDPLTVR